MKMTDKSFAIKIEGSVFTGNEIYKMEVEGTSFKLFCGYENGTKFEISGNLKNLEFLGSVPTSREWEGYEMCGDRGFYGPPFGSHKNDTDMVTPLERIRQAFHEINECNNEIIYPSHPMHKELTEILKRIKEDPATEVKDIRHGKYYVCNGKSNVSDDATVKAMKDAADAIGKAAEAICKATEQIKVDLSIDGKKFSKLIKKYNQDITRSGG